MEKMPTRKRLPVTGNTLRPIVKIISSGKGALQPHGPLISLANYGTQERRIIGVLDPEKERLDPRALLRLATELAV
jgi:hypothetical protein